MHVYMYSVFPLTHDSEPENIELLLSLEQWCVRVFRFYERHFGENILASKSETSQ